VQGYRTVNISCTVWYKICNIYILLHVSTDRCHPQGVIIPKVYNQHNNICSTPPNKLLIYAINAVSHSTCVGWYIDCKNRYSVNSRKLQNVWINMWTEGTVAVRGKDYTGITGVMAHPPVWKHKCWSGVDATDCQEVLWGPPLGTTTVLVPSLLEPFGTRPTATIMSPSLTAVSTVRERPAFTSSITVYNSCLTQTLLQLFKPISVRV
jgi:hypothetical protein